MLTRMKQAIRLGVIGAAIVFFGVSCATVPRSQNQSRVEDLIAELNTASVERLVELSARPFLLDGEIVVVERDIAMMWTNLRDVGFTFDGAAIEEVGALRPDDYLAFGDTMDVRVWFDKYTTDDAGLARVATTHGTFLIVTGEAEDIGLQVFGFTGPQE